MRTKRSQRRDRGQASVEYVLIVFLVLAAGAAGLQTFLPDALAAWDRYVAGLFLVLSLPVP